MPNYRLEYFKNDLISGITVAIMLIPQGMAYALIAGLPPIYGLYAALTPQIVYAFLGTSKQLAVGPVAMDSLLVAAGLGALSIVGPSQYIQMALLLALLMGVIQFLLGLLRMGFIVAFLSKPVISGFTSAAAIIIGLNQIKHILGISIPQSNKIHIFISLIINSQTQINFYALAIGLISILLLVVIKKCNSKIPSALVVVIISIFYVSYANYDQKGLAIVGEIPNGLPNFVFPFLEWDIIKSLLPISLTIALVGFMEAISIAKSIEEKNKTDEINPNQELIALGASNIIGSFFQSYPTSGGFSRTAVNNHSGAKTGVSALISAIIVGVILSFFTDWFYYLPNAALGAIIIVAVTNLIDYKYIFGLYKERKDEFFVLIFTFIGTLFIGITEGILFGIILSLLILVYRTSKPHYAFLGRIGTTNYFKNIDRFPDEVVLRDDLIILRFDAQLFFGNIQFFKNLIFDSVNNNHKKVKGYIINARTINYIDSTALEKLTEIIIELQKKGIRVMVVGATGPTRDMIIKSKLIKVLKKGNLFITSGDATDSFDGVRKKSPLQKKLSRQTNK